MKDKEQVYDEQVAPLMTEIIRICEEHKIAMLADFFIPTPEDPELRCTTALLKDEHEPTKEQLRAFEILRPDQSVRMTRTTLYNQDGSVASRVLFAHLGGAGEE